MHHPDSFMDHSSHVCATTRAEFQATNRLDADQLTRALLGVDVNDRDAGGRGEPHATQVRCAIWAIAVPCTLFRLLVVGALLARAGRGG